MDNQNEIGTAPEQQEKTFTQEQVNAIVGKRLSEQKQQLEGDFVKREQDLKSREMSLRAREILSERGLPKDLADVLRYDNEESLVKAVDTIEHIRGFKKEDKAAGNEERRIVIENKLPKSNHEIEHDSIRDAFKLSEEG